MAEISAATFKDENRALQELARELHLLRQHNLNFREGDPQQTLLLMAEAALTCLTMEHFVRVVVGDAAPAGATLFNLLEVAFARNLLRLPWDDQREGIRKVCAVRNTLLHGNYAKAAREGKRESVADYFKSVFASEVEGMFKVTDYIMKQIDVATGKPLGRSLT
jgi:hypothetical protein